jgi:hypothetical protein
MKKIEKLIGISAGKICFTNFNAYDFYLQKLIDEAQVIWESGRSAWTLLSQDVDGRTRWLSPEEDQVAMLLPDDEIYIEEIS